ncbi:MAG TPA: glycine cleavage system protein H [Planctomycetaceae bacterium]|jgi:glycine cleavage system H protein|nr:glycine cleavage system protein H [Planctomycetaceae bacterium]HCP11072.1 glycine cleavage system protein H [Planctomycetaceae bacterium]
MQQPFVFMMGQYEAQMPADRLYSRRHLWLQPCGPDVYRVGFTAYSVRLLQDVYFLEWSIDEGAVVRDRQEIGEIESAKAVSSMFPPSAGTVLRFNPQLLRDPAGINADNYGAGWLYEFLPEGELLTAEQYLQYLQTAWEEAQRTIKGQINEG